jgi:hypothetical protein
MIDDDARAKGCMYSSIYFLCVCVAATLSVFTGLSSHEHDRKREDLAGGSGELIHLKSTFFLIYCVLTHRAVLAQPPRTGHAHCNKW